MTCTNCSLRRGSTATSRMSREYCLLVSLLINIYIKYNSCLSPFCPVLCFLMEGIVFLVFIRPHCINIKFPKIVFSFLAKLLCLLAKNLHTILLLQSLVFRIAICLTKLTNPKGNLNPNLINYKTNTFFKNSLILLILHPLFQL